MTSRKENRNSSSSMFFKIGILKNFTFHSKTSVLESLFDKVGGLRALLLANTSGGYFWK